ncbi:MAG: YcxB family protein [Clostridia bacterium]
MKNLKIFPKIILAFALIICLSFTAFAESFSYDIPDTDVTVTLPDGTYIFSPSTSIYSDDWDDAGLGLANSADYNSLYEDLGVTVHFTNNNGETNVYVCKNETDSTEDYYSFLEMDEDAINELVTTYSGDEETYYSHASLQYINDVPFIAMDLYYDMEDGTYIYEYIIFTIINGYSISFSTHSGEVLTEESLAFLDEIVNTANITNIIDSSEAGYTFAEAILILIVLLILVATLVSFFVKISIDEKKNKKHLKMLADKLSEYRLQVANNPDIERHLIFENTTLLTDTLVKNYTYYQCYRKKALSSTISIVFAIACITFAYIVNTQTWIVLALVALLVFYFYKLLVSGPNLEKYLKRVHSKFLSTKAHYKFFENDFSISGIQHIEFYPYFQITNLGESKDAFYLYFGDKNCLFVNKFGFTVAEQDDFKKFITEKIKKD